jgi:hypothetical protein
VGRTTYPEKWMVGKGGRQRKRKRKRRSRKKKRLLKLICSGWKLS